MKIEPKFLFADEISLHDAAALMAGIENPTSSSFASSYHDLYDPEYDQDEDQDERRHEAMNEQVALLDGAIKRGQLLLRHNPDGGKWGDLLDKQQWILWIEESGRYCVLLQALRASENKCADDKSCANEIYSPTVMDVANLDCNETGIHVGRNKRSVLEKWVACMARKLYVKGDVTTVLAEKIVKAAGGRILPERGDELKVANVLKMLPRGITGGRANNGRRSSNMARMNFEKSKADGQS